MQGKSGLHLSEVRDKSVQIPHGTEIQRTGQRIEIPLHVPHMLESETGGIEPEYD
jgi:hypothetical protein